MGTSDSAAYDPSVGVRRRHLPIAEAAMGRKALLGIIRSFMSRHDKRYESYVSWLLPR